MYVQGESLKTCAAFLPRLLNSPASRLEGTMELIRGGFAWMGAAAFVILAAGFALGQRHPKQTLAPSSPAPQVEVFGASYDECLLKNATKGGDVESRDVATGACERHFIRTATPVEAISTGITSALFVQDDGNDGISFTITNNNQNVTIKHASVTVAFDGPDGPLTWDHDINAEPGKTVAFFGNFPTGKVPGKKTSDGTGVFKVLPENGLGG